MTTKVNRIKTASKLKITLDERAALIKVMGWLKDGVLHEDINGATGKFNMNTKCNALDCGTVACIGGWVYLAMQKIAIYAKTPSPVILAKACDYVGSHKSPELHGLYYPYQVKKDWGTITSAEAAQAIRNFLTSGDPQWASIVEPTDLYHES